MVGLIAGLGSLASSAIGAIGAGRARRKAEKQQRKILDQMSADNESNFLRDYYQDAFDDPSSRSYLKRISDSVYEQGKRIQNTGIATGATHENTLAQKQAANEVMSDAVNNVVVNHEGQKRVAKDQYIQRKDAIASGNMDMAQRTGDAKAQNWTNLGNNMAGSITDLASASIKTGGRLFGAVPGLDSVTKQSGDYARGFAASQSQEQMNRLNNWN